MNERRRKYEMNIPTGETLQKIKNKIERSS